MSNTPKPGLCPDCKAVVSLLASACPRCGRPITEGDLIELPKPKMRIFQWGCVAIVLFFILIMIIGAVSHQSLTEEDRMRQIRKNQQTGREMYR